MKNGLEKGTITMLKLALNKANQLAKEVDVIRNTISPYLKNESVQKMKDYMQHGHVSTFQHSINVVVISYMIAKIWNWKVDLSVLLVGALLHDFYLYDYHTGRIRDNGIHGFIHPVTAKENAIEHFELTGKELNVIESHMFPLTITKWPRCKEAIIVSIADKYCAIKEAHM